MKRLTLMMLFCTAVILQISAQAGFGKAYNFNSDWEFRNKDEKDEFRNVSDKENWRKVKLPHDWSVEGPYSPTYASSTGYLPGGIGWYRKYFQVSDQVSAKQYYVWFGGIMNNSEVYLNGKLLGKRPNGYVGQLYDITPGLIAGKDNLLEIKVDHTEFADSRWYNGSGIYRDVYLIESGKVHIDPFGVYFRTSEVSGSSAILQISTTVSNHDNVEHKVHILQRVLEKTSGKVVLQVKRYLNVPANGKSTADVKEKISNPKLWTLKDPALYEIYTEILNNKESLDHNTFLAGIRKVSFDPDKGFSLNNKSMKLKGVCIHHDAGALGAAVPAQVWERRLKTLKSMGVNAIRTSHNPQDDALYQICDRIGLMVMDEAFDEWEYPKRKWLEGWNKGTPGFQGYAKYFNEWSDRDITDQVIQHRNHPSIIMWSIGNEVDYPNDPYSHPSLNEGSISQKAVIGYKPDQPNAERLGDIAQRLVKTVKNADNSRPVTGALAGVIMSNHTRYPYALDVAGYNYTENRYEMDHASYPKRSLYGSENRHELSAWKAVTDHDYIAGQFLWTGLDYLGEAGAWPSRGFGTGLLDLAGNMKTLAWYRKSLWAEEPMIYLATTDRRHVNFMYGPEPKWNYEINKEVTVACFSNCDSVNLFLNDLPVKVKSYRDDNTGAWFWKVPFTKGSLKAVGYINGLEAVNNVLKTSGRPDKLHAEIYEPDGKSDLVQIEVSILDADGIPVYDSDDLISVKIDGEARLLGIENGNMSEMIPHNLPFLRANHGKLIIYIQKEKPEGKINVELNANWITGLKLEW